MRIYGSVQICFWANQDTQQISDQAKLLAIYLLTGPHSNMLGCFRLPDGYIREDLSWDLETVKTAFSELCKINFLTRDDSSNWLVIHQFLNWNPIQNPKQGIGIKKIFEMAPKNSPIYKPLLKSLITYGKYFDEEFVDRLESLSQDCVADKEQNQDQNKNQEQKQNTTFMSGKPDAVLLGSNNLYKREAREILEFLNEKTGKNFRPDENNLKLIVNVLRSGIPSPQCFQVIASKTREWKKDPKTFDWLRPKTLFNRTNFEQYVGELGAEKPKDTPL